MTESNTGSNSSEPISRAQEREFCAGEVLYTSGEDATEIFLLLRGKVRVVLESDTPQAPSQVLETGDFFGESGIVRGRVRRGTAVALTDGSLRALRRSDLSACLALEPELAVGLVAHLAEAMEELREQVELLSFEDRRTRVIVALSRLARERAAAHDLSNATPIELPVSPLDLSKLVGVDVDSVKGVVRELREAGHLRVTNGQVEVNNIDSLRTLTDLLELRDRISGRRPQRRAGRVRRSD